MVFIGLRYGLRFFRGLGNPIIFLDLQVPRKLLFGQIVRSVSLLFCLFNGLNNLDLIRRLGGF